MSETEGAPKKYEVSVQTMDEQCTKASGEFDDLTQLGEMDAGQIAELLDRFHRLPYPQPGLPEDHCQPQVLVPRGGEWLSFIHDGGKLLECQTDTHLNSEEGAALVERHFATAKSKTSGGFWRLLNFFRG